MIVRATVESREFGILHLLPLLQLAVERARQGNIGRAGIGTGIGIGTVYGVLKVAKIFGQVFQGTGGSRRGGAVGRNTSWHRNAVERALEAADVAPTPAQQQFVTDALAKLALVKREWDRAKAGALTDLNAELTPTSEKPVVIPDRDKVSAEQPQEGEDLP